MQSACTGIHCDALSRSAIGREFLFEACYFGAEDELTAFQYTGDRGINFGLDAVILRFQIEIWDFDISHECYPASLRGRLQCGQPQIYRTAVLRHRLRCGL